MASPDIHPTACVSPHANLADGVIVKPFAVIEDNVEIGANCVIGPHAVIHKYVRMGSGNKIHAHAVIGDLGHDTGFDENLETWVHIGDDNTIREGVTIHRATHPETTTTLGNRAFLMAYAHIAHDCQVGDDVIFSNNICLGGHVEVGNKVVLGGAVVIHQFSRIGDFVMCAGFMAVRKDVMPYTMVAGDPARHFRLNTVGLRRSGVKGDKYKTLEKAYREIRGGNKTLDGIEETEQVLHLKAWLAADSKRGLTGFLKEK